ncbi:DUF3099 domain-containing protein [Streptomyces albus subsp. chlorinus]|uniref:DUF3099 domain-containing protein n=1 Tax=Streptomyces albus TaxID=1888 RepID=UPI0015713DD6|nr:DUF3099 domain-containing protein [Streptomyces albus]NSC20933.1 DUF3099 domain-containing protein [Streptomyces albus subsp. chlorinus]
MRKLHQPEVFRITGARQGLQEDVRGRQRRYVISMLVRTVAVLLTVVLWNVERPLAIVTLVLGVTLPYIAVVIANAGRENAPSAPATYLPDTRQHVLEGSKVTKAEEGSPPEEAGRTPNGAASDRS